MDSVEEMHQRLKELDSLPIEERSQESVRQEIKLLRIKLRNTDTIYKYFVPSNKTNITKTSPQPINTSESRSKPVLRH